MRSTNMNLVNGENIGKTSFGACRTCGRVGWWAVWKHKDEEWSLCENCSLRVEQQQRPESLECLEVICHKDPFCFWCCEKIAGDIYVMIYRQPSLYPIETGFVLCEKCWKSWRDKCLQGATK